MAFSDWSNDKKKKKYSSFSEYSNAQKGIVEEDIAPIKTSGQKALDRAHSRREEEEEKRTFFQSGALDDGEGLLGIGKAIGGTISDVTEDIVKGGGSFLERTWDGLMSLGAAMNRSSMNQAAESEIIYNALSGNKEAASKTLDRYNTYQDQVERETLEYVEKNLIDEEQIAKAIITDNVKRIGIDVEEDSVLGERSDELVQSATDVALRKAISLIPGVGTGLSLTLTGASVLGGEVENAAKQDATFDEAILSGMISAGAELGSEYMFGGIKFGGKTLTEGAANTLASTIRSKTLATLAKWGFNTAGEGFEEVASGWLSAVGQNLTYADEKELGELFTWGDAWDNFVGGALLGGLFEGVNIKSASKHNIDYVSGLTKDERKVVDKVYNDAIAEAEKNGKKITTREKTKIFDDVVGQAEKGYISTDTIEEVLGGESYKAYKSAFDSENTMQSEFDELNKMKQGEMTGEQIDRRLELKQQLEELKNNKTTETLKNKLSNEVFGLVKDSKLAESYNEQGRRGQYFEADLSNYDKKYRDIVQKAIDSKTLNNTNRTHELVDMIAKISADKGVSFDFTNNAKLKETGFAIDGTTINGYVTKDGITLNTDSAKYLNSVVGHEVTHVLEGTELYKELQNTLIEYAKTKNDYQGRYDSLTALYKDVKDADINAELTADLVGDYLFTDSDFISKLSTEHRNVFQKIYDEIKYLYKVATAGSKEARELEKVKRAFDKAYKESGKVTDTKYSLTNKNITDESTGYASGESYYTMSYKQDGKVVGTLEYGEYNGEPNVKMIEVDPEYRRKGIATKLLQELQNKYPDVEIYFGMSTPDGTKLLESITYDVTDEAVVADRQKLKDLQTELNDLQEKLDVLYDTENLTEAQETELEKLGDRWTEVYDSIRDLESSLRGKRATKTFVKTDTKYSLSDSDGKQLTKEQQSYFMDSKVRDENGNLKVMYHGSQDAGFHVFDSKMSDDDTSFFFVDRNDVAASYSGTSETYEAKTIRTTEDMNNFLAEIGYDSYKAVETDGKFELLENNEHVAYSDTAQGLYDEFCWYEGVGEGDANYKVYLNLKNPLIVDAENRNWNNISREFSQEVADRYNSLTAEEKSALAELADWGEYSIFRDEMLESRAIAEQGGSGAFFDEAYTKTLARAYEKLGGANANLYDAFSIASDNFSEESLNKFAMKQMNTRDYAKKAKAEGYDGVIFRNIHDNGGYSNGSEGASTVAVAFSPEQIKSVANAKPTTDPDIRYSLSAETDNNYLSVAESGDKATAKKMVDEAAKEAGFALDEDGMPDLLFHGTDSFGFTKIDTSKSDDNLTFWATPNMGVAGSYYDGSNYRIREIGKEKVAPKGEKIQYYHSMEKAISTAKQFSSELNLDLSKAKYIKESTVMKKAKKSIQKAVRACEVVMEGDFDDSIKNIARRVVSASKQGTYDALAKELNQFKWQQFQETTGVDFFEIDLDENFNIDKSDISKVTQVDADVFKMMYHIGEVVDNLSIDDNGTIKGKTIDKVDIAMPYNDLVAEKGIYGFYHKENNPFVYDCGGVAWNKIEIPNEAKGHFTESTVTTRQLAEWAFANGYDAIKLDNVIDVGEHAIKEARNPSTVWAFKNPESQIKSADPITYDNNGNVIPLSERFNTEKNDIRYSLSRMGEQPKKYGNLHIKGEDVAYRGTAPIKETVKKDVLPDDFAPMTEQDAAELQRDSLANIDEADMPPESNTEYYDIPDNTRLDERAEKSLVNTLNGILNLDGREKAVMRGVVQKYSTGEIQTDAELFDEIKKNFGERTWTTKDDVAAEVKKYLRTTKVKVSDTIKGDIADYNRFRLKNCWGKVRVNKEGVPVDSLYMELSELYPSFFPEDITNPTEQFLKMVDVANTDYDIVEGYNLEDAEIQAVANIISSEIGKYKEAELMKSAEADRQAFLRDISRGKITAPIKETVQTESKAAKTENVEDSVKEEKIAKLLPPKTEAPKEKSRTAMQARMLLSDKQAPFEDLSLKTGNRELMAKADALHRAESRAQRFIGKGADGVRSLLDIKAETEKAGLYEEFKEYMTDWLNVDRMSLESNAKKKIDSLQGKFGNLKFEQIQAIAAKKITKNTTERTAQTIREAREYLKANDTHNKAVYGDSVTADISRAKAEKAEALHPQFKQWAKDVYAITEHLRKEMVDGGVISQELSDALAEMYPHYIPIKRDGKDGAAINVPLDSRKTGVNTPIKRATGGNSDIVDMWETLSTRIEQTYKAVARNSLGIELKNALGAEGIKTSATFDEINENFDNHEELLKKGENGMNPTFTIFENGERVEFEITEDFYDALKPKNDFLAKKIKPFNTLMKIQRGILTEYNLLFSATNAVKDAQSVLVNSQHPAETYMSFPESLKELTVHAFTGKEGTYLKEYLGHGGENITYFDNQNKLFTKEDSGIKKVLGFVPRKISEANNFIEKIPRLAEYIASRKNGASIDVAMLDAARVTTNFSAGGDLAKWANRNGFTFLNASIQGFNQQVRNVREAKANGLKGMLQLAAKYAVAGLPVMLLNGLLWDDDEEYEELSDYIKDNYYIVGKTQDGKFIRIPKGREVAVIQNAFEQMKNLITGDDKVDMARFGELLVENIAPNNPLTNNIFAPLYQAHTNTAWYGGDLVPARLQDLPLAEQYDESTDAISKWLADTSVGKVLNLSPYRVNYLLDQYSGGIGDMFLPMLTPETDGGGILAPWQDKFTTDSTMKNQNVSDFYDTKDKLTTNAKSSNATDEDILKSKYINSVNTDLSELYQRKREIQNSSLSDKEKDKQVKAIQEQINAMAKESLNAYNNVSIDGGYATVGNLHYKLNKEGEWEKVTDKQLDKQEDVTSGLGISASEYWSNKEEYDYAYESPEKYAIAKAVGGYDTYKSYSSELYDIKADKDENGKSISGSRKEKVVEYINNLDADYGEKIILFKSQYNADDTYNYEIVDYLNSRDDISYSEMETILKELGFDVSADGTITWD